MKLVLLLSVSLCALGCEVFVIGAKQSPPAVEERSQRSSVGVVRLWMAEIERRNLPAAAELMRHPSGRPLLAAERHEIADDLDRWYHLLKDTPVTVVSIDTLFNAHRITMQTSRQRRITFTTAPDENLWYVTAVR